MTTNTFLPFTEAKKIVHRLNLKSAQEWRDYKTKNKIENIPSHPEETYKDEWIDWIDWLGKDQQKLFAEINVFFKKIKLKTIIDWQKYCKLPCVDINHILRTPIISNLAKQPRQFNLKLSLNTRRERISLEKLLKDIETIVLPKHNMELPSQAIISQTEYNLNYSLKCAIGKFGGYNKIRSKLGLSVKSIKPRGFWQLWENVDAEIKKSFAVNLKNKKFPSQSEFKLAGIRIDYICEIHEKTYEEIANMYECQIPFLYKCRDGDFVDSSYEVIFDEFMYSRGIKHDIHPPIDRYFADFLVGGFYVEIWGL